jgi:hypothetical protein
MTAAAPHAASFAARVVDPERRGSTWGQVLIGVVGVLLALTLVLGQVALVATRNIQRNLASNVEQMRTGNRTMHSITKKSQPAVEMDTLVARQAATLTRINRTMVQLNAEMGRVGSTTDGLAGTVGDMERTGGTLAADVARLSATAGRMEALLGRLPAATTRTHRQIEAIGSDTGDINGELEAIAAKMARYGLPPAKGVKKR